MARYIILLEHSENSLGVTFPSVETVFTCRVTSCTGSWAKMVLAQLFGIELRRMLWASVFIFVL